MKRIIIVLFLLVCSSAFSNVQKIFTGAQSTDFSDALNWMGGVAPLNGDDIVIKSVCVFGLSPSANTFASLTLGMGTESGELTIQNSDLNVFDVGNISALSGVTGTNKLALSTNSFLKVRGTWNYLNMLFDPGVYPTCVIFGGGNSVVLMPDNIPYYNDLKIISPGARYRTRTGQDIIKGDLKCEALYNLTRRKLIFTNDREHKIESTSPNQYFLAQGSITLNEKTLVKANVAVLGTLEVNDDLVPDPLVRFDGNNGSIFNGTGKVIVNCTTNPVHGDFIEQFKNFNYSTLSGLTIEYSGSSEQVISHLPGSNYYGSVIINNGSGAKTSPAQTVSIGNVLTFTAGKITLGNFSILKIGPSGSISNADANNYIITTANSKVIDENISNLAGPSIYTFPIGPNSSKYNPVYFSGASGNVSARVIQQQYHPTLPNMGINNTWTLSGNGTAALRFDWNQSDVGSDFNTQGPIFIIHHNIVTRGYYYQNVAAFEGVDITGESDYQVGKIAKIKSDGNNQYSTPDMSAYNVTYTWKLQNLDPNCTASLINNTTNVCTVDPGNALGRSILWLTVIYLQLGNGIDDFVLPFHINWQNNSSVDLASFTHTANQQEVNLKWTTGEENNNSGFSIERRTVVNGSPEEWKEISFVNGNEYSNGPKEYSFIDKDLNTGEYQYRLKQTDENGIDKYFELNEEVKISMPLEFSILQNYPNPFNPTTKIDFNLPSYEKVKLTVFDNTGREIKTLLNEYLEPGYYSREFDASELTSGVYFYRINAGNYVVTKKMLLVK